MANASELKDFLANICIEAYPDLEKHEKEMPAVERNWPVFSEQFHKAETWKDSAFEQGAGAAAPSATSMENSTGTSAPEVAAQSPMEKHEKTECQKWGQDL